MAGTESQDEIRKLLDEMIEAQNSGDALRLRIMLSERPDAVYIGTDAGRGGPAVSSRMTWRPSAAGDDIRAVADDIDVHVQGDIAWAEGHGRFTRADGAERPVRMTCVLVHEGGQWTAVQSHASIGSQTRTSSADAQRNG